MPVSSADLLLFTWAAASLNLIPGNDMMYVLGQSLRSGPKVGVAASFGISAGSAVHLILVALGVAVLLQHWPILFDAIRYVGAAYLLWIAVQTLRQAHVSLTPDQPPRRSYHAFRDGVLVNLLNPKVIVFMFAFLPPFVRPENGQPLLQLLIYGSIFIIGGTVVNSLVAIFAGRIGAALAQSAKMRVWFARVSAGLFVMLAARLVLEKNNG